ncbi:hypothetical protein KFL_001750010 [Klebsormidium nitens]|uniref:Uncharacterized protein n=1 Tax=Klebsormidium nitens TaxID=105231 RepID=A0A1Y1HZI0_KLENI|nr:hypothetical protein KFL_001750010 [Klebsormidium nitens]|eukprot:GAQ84064.1 hypothetical protein KFL_001750010 [Klebsormidium nitens]
MGAYRDRVDAGFRTRQELREFFTEMEETVSAFHAICEDGLQVFSEKYCARCTPPAVYEYGMLHEQEYIIRYYGCEIPFYMLRELVDTYEFDGAYLLRLKTQIKAENLRERCRKDNGTPETVLARRQARYLAHRRTQTDVKDRIGAAQERQTKAIVNLVEFLKAD